MKNLIYTIALALIATTVFAVTPTSDDDSKKIYVGYVVLENGETLEGKIEMLSPTLNEIKVKFIDPNGSQTIYKAKEVVSYGFNFPVYNAATQSYDEQAITYVKKTVEDAPIPFGPKEVLIEMQVSGKINLYNFYMETRAAEHAFEHNFYLEKNGQMVKMTRDNFKDVMREMVEDYPELKAKVGTKGFGYKYTPEIIEEYNRFVTGGGSTMIGMN